MTFEHICFFLSDLFVALQLFTKASVLVARYHRRTSDSQRGLIVLTCLHSKETERKIPQLLEKLKSHEPAWE